MDSYGYSHYTCPDRAGKIFFVFLGSEDSIILYLLLGRPWIHEAGAIPSSLHQ